jgi:transposase-like protein
MNNKNTKQENYKKVSCPRCKSENIIKRGYFQTQAHGKQQRYYCKSCNKKFIEQTPFYRMRNNPQKITLCLDLFYKGVSTRQIQQHLHDFYPHNASWVSVYKWIIRYSKLISNFTDNLKIKVGKELQVDEMQIGSQKSRYNDWFVDSIDTTTRYMVASEFGKSRDEKSIKKVLGKAKIKSENKFDMITTDGFTIYDKSVKNVFGYYHFQRGDKIHKVVTQLKNEGFNIKIERMHNSIRHRIKTFRGFHGSVSSANAIMKGYEIYYNFIRKHLALGKTPSELETDIKLEGNKWLELINLSFS